MIFSKTDLSPTIDLLFKVESERLRDIRNICRILSIDLTSVGGRILASESKFGPKNQFDTLLEQIDGVLSDQRSLWSTRDWPFENFWGNPYETKHSKLLGYFLRPTEAHGCGEFLLNKFFEILKNQRGLPQVDKFVAEHCQVYTEVDHIDVLIMRNRSDGKFAIIIENKINGAINQDEQLHRYVETVTRQGFDPKQIHVLYLPLNAGKRPEADDSKAVKESGAWLSEISFEKNIIAWLDAVLSADGDRECPNLRAGMHLNLAHYRDLIRYLSKKNN